MAEYEAAKFAAEYVWNTFDGPNREKKQLVIEILESYINRKLNEELETVNLYFLDPGRIDLMSKYCSQEAGVYNALRFDLIITKENVRDRFVDLNKPIFEADSKKNNK